MTGKEEAFCLPVQKGSLSILLAHDGANEYKRNIGRSQPLQNQNPVDGEVHHEKAFSKSETKIRKRLEGKRSASEI